MTSRLNCYTWCKGLLVLLMLISLQGCARFRRTLVSNISTPSPIPKTTPSPTEITNSRYTKPGDYIHEIEVGKHKRWFTAHLPPGYQPGVPMPLVVNIHGRTATAFQQEALSKMNAIADREGFIVVNPQASGNPPTWWGAVPTEIGNADMAFFQAMLDTLLSEISIDPHRIYASGMSNGGSMANRLACDMSETFAAIAVVSGSHVLRENCHPTHPVPVIAFHGKKDTIIPYEGREVGDYPSTHAWVYDWVYRNHCAPEPEVSHPAQDITLEVWHDCAEGATVVLYTLEEAGHTWPGSSFGTYFGGTTESINASELIWSFFEAHTKP